MQDQRYLPQFVGARVLTDAQGGRLRDVCGHPFRLTAPGLVRHFVHVAIVTGKITAAVDLDDEFSERGRAPAVSEKRGDIEGEWPLQALLGSHDGIKSHSTPFSTFKLVATGALINPV